MKPSVKNANKALVQLRIRVRGIFLKKRTANENKDTIERIDIGKKKVDSLKKKLSRQSDNPFAEDSICE